MIEIKDKEKCCGCHACYNICPKNAISMKEDENGFKYPVVDKEKCINCGLCEKVCPIINSTEKENNINAYACINKNEQIRKQSSSGGIFTLLAEEIIKLNGVVFGVSFDKDFNVVHSYIENIDELEKFRGSKYVQSSINDTYKKAKEFLNKDRYVLFTGTPCQIEGLKAYLQKDYDKLYTQDIICHGVPSPKVWKKYLEYRKKKDNRKAENISFRNKDTGWKLFNMKFEYKDTAYKKNQTKDAYMQVFLQNLCLRDSCYNCSFKKKNRNSDITLADFWGIQNIYAEMDDNKGTSLIILNSSKGNELFEKIKQNIKYKEVNLDEALKYNIGMMHSVNKNGKRENFFIDLDNLEFDKLSKKYVKKTNIIKRVASKIKRIIRV